MVLYHRTNAALQILRDGFRDAGPANVRGVWLSAPPWSEPEVKGRHLLRVRIPVARIREFESTQWAEHYRAFCVPAGVVNEYAPYTLLTQAEEDRIYARQHRRVERLVQTAGGLEAWMASRPEQDEEEVL